MRADAVETLVAEATTRAIGLRSEAFRGARSPYSALALLAREYPDLDVRAIWDRVWKMTNEEVRAP